MIWPLSSAEILNRGDEYGIIVGWRGSSGRHMGGYNGPNEWPQCRLDGGGIRGDQPVLY